MKTLIIHPKDQTTHFATRIYHGLGHTVINDGVSKSEIKRQIRDHEKIICIGHGTPSGLINPKHSKNQLHYIVDSTMVYILREKFCILFWCHANEFQTKYKIPGLATGMIISEVNEAWVFNITATLEDIQVANYELANTLQRYLIDGVFEYIPKNQVMEFNLKSLYQFIENE